MHTNAILMPRRLACLEPPLADFLGLPEPGDVVRFALDADGQWFYGRVDDLVPGGDLVCSVIEAQSWPLLMLEGIVPGVRYVISPDNVLSVVRRNSAT